MTSNLCSHQKRFFLDVMHLKNLSRCEHGTRIENNLYNCLRQGLSSGARYLISSIVRVVRNAANFSILQDIK